MLPRVELPRSRKIIGDSAGSNGAPRRLIFQAAALRPLPCAEGAGEGWGGVLLLHAGTKQRGEVLCRTPANKAPGCAPFTRATTAQTKSPDINRCQGRMPKAFRAICQPQQPPLVKGARRQAQGCGCNGHGAQSLLHKLWGEAAVGDFTAP